MGGGGLVALLMLFVWSFVSVIVLLIFITVPLDDLQCLIVLFPDHTHLILTPKIPLKKVVIIIYVLVCDSGISGNIYLHLRISFSLVRYK